MEAHGLVCVLVLVWAGCPTAPGSDRPEPARSIDVPVRELDLAQAVALLWPDDRAIEFRPSTLREQEMVRQLVPALMAGRAPAEQRRVIGHDPIERAGFVLELWRVEGRAYWALREQPGREHGAGTYLFRAAPSTSSPRYLLQAPHAYFDRHTGAIAARVFFASPAGARVHALFSNSIHRYQAAPRQRTRAAANPADLAHLPEHIFTVATAAAAASAPVSVVQLHGFAARDGLREVGAVVSAGDRAGSSARSTAVADAVAAVLPEPALRFPEQTRALGATTNAQGRSLGDDDDFVHIELSAVARKHLASTPADVDRLASALLAPAK